MVQSALAFARLAWPQYGPVALVIWAALAQLRLTGAAVPAKVTAQVVGEELGPVVAEELGPAGSIVTAHDMTAADQPP